MQSKGINLVECLLERANTTIIGGKSLGELISARDYHHLWEEREKGEIDTVVIHFISAINIAPKRAYDTKEILKIFPEYGVSSHYLLSREGLVYNLVPEEKKAWHAGSSIMPEPDSREGVNEFSIGIEFVATRDSGFTKEQYTAGASLCADIERRRGDMIYTGHEDVAGKRAFDLGLRSDIKEDPGPGFKWKEFRDSISELRG